ncbi:fhkD [Symbiodinium natans]|uniref:FhkD protein n=1 Tax=Symbiodinium natans TaxID=878477 RepID=A0A812QX46_9DINO|nr:fhkD [Symbiodinium natans]
MDPARSGSTNQLRTALVLALLSKAAWAMSYLLARDELEHWGLQNRLLQIQVLSKIEALRPSQPSAGISSEPSQGEQLHQADSFMDLSQCWIPPPAPFLEIGGPSDIQEPDPELEPLSEVSMGALVTESFLAGLEEDLRQSEAAEASQPPCKRQRLESKASP